MRLFLYEHTCAIAADEGVGASLRTEGQAMWSALREDFQRLPDVRVTSIRNGRVWPHDPDGSCPPEDPPALFRRLAASADVTLVIAPEFDRLLETYCGLAQKPPARSLNASLAAIRLTADKLACGRWLRARGIPTPACLLLREADPVPASWFPAVCKPRFGAGSVATFLVSDRTEWQRCQDRAWAEGWTGAMLLQQFHPGLPASVALLAGPCQIVPLLASTQQLSNEGRLHYLGGTMPLRPALNRRAQDLAIQCLSALPGLVGYVGVDLVLGDAPDGSEDAVIEINPRLTTSYIGLRALCETNLAEALLHLMAGEAIRPLRWRWGALTFQTDGRVQWRGPG